MASATTPTPAPQVSDTPETATLLLATFAELYRHEVGAQEDVHRTLPFFGTALGIVAGLSHMTVDSEDCWQSCGGL